MPAPKTEPRPVVPLLSREQDVAPPSKRRTASRRTKLLVFALALVAAPLLVEVEVRAFVPVRNVGPSFTVFDPVYGKALKKSFHCTRVAPEFTMSFTTNSLGFRGPEPARFPAHAVLFIGDSLTMGHGVDDGKDFPALVGRALDERFGAGSIPVINAGVGSTGNGWWIKFLRNEAAKYEPRIVVLEVCSNDPSDNWNERLFSLDDRAALVELPVPSPSWKRVAQTFVEAIPGLSNSYAISYLREDHSSERAGGEDVRGAVLAADSKTPTRAESLTLALVREAIAMCRGRGWPVLLISGNLEPTDDRFARSLAALCAEVRVNEVRVPLPPERPEYYFRVDRHWTETGHAAVAKLVLDALLERRELSPGVPPEPSPGASPETSIGLR
jgi:hypothetical protein